MVEVEMQLQWLLMEMEVLVVEQDFFQHQVQWVKEIHLLLVHLKVNQVVQVDQLTLLLWVVEEELELLDQLDNQVQVDLEVMVQVFQQLLLVAMEQLILVQILLDIMLAVVVEQRMFQVKVILQVV